MLDNNPVELPSHEPRQQRFGRPRINPAERRTKPLRMFLNEAESAQLRENAAAVGMNRHDYVRALIAGHKPQAKSGGYDPRILNELNAIGNNLNQAVRDMHAGSQRRRDWEALRDLLQTALLQVALGDDSDVH